MLYLFTHTSERLQANKQLKLEMIPSVSPSYEMKIHESAKSSQKRSTMDLMSDEFCDVSDQISPILATLPWSPMVFDDRSLHLACENGDLELGELLIQRDRNFCLRKDSSGMTPLHVAIQKGRVDVINLILRYCPESVKEVTATTMETCFDMAVKHNKNEVVLYLEKWILEERPDLSYLLNFRDFEGNTAIEISTPKVFLSFKGEDTRKTFTNHLYIALVQAGIHTFRDDEEIEKGENIELELEKAIEQSRISIIVLSKGYATSSWCLDELVQILDCKKKFGHVILPIFYGIEPSQVRNQTGNLAKAFARQEYGLKVDRWREALTEVANLGGMVLQNYDDGIIITTRDLSSLNFEVDKIYTPKELDKDPESLKEVTAATMEMCPDVAVRHNKIEVVVHLLNWIIGERPDFRYLLNCREGNTALQFYFSSKLLKSIGVLHSGKLSDANALNSGGSMALDTSYYLPHSEKVDIVTDKILHKPRDTGLPKNSGALRGDGCSHGGLSNRPSYTTFTSIGFRIGLLLTATLFATITYQVPFHLNDSTSKEGSKHYLIILLNSVVFISSVGVIIFILHEFPLKPWPHISISVVFGSYMFSLNAIMPDGTLVLLFISIPILLVCFFGKTLWLCKLKFHWNI